MLSSMFYFHLNDLSEFRLIRGPSGGLALLGEINFAGCEIGLYINNKFILLLSLGKPCSFCRFPRHQNLQSSQFVVSIFKTEFIVLRVVKLWENPDEIYLSQGLVGWILYAYGRQENNNKFSWGKRVQKVQFFVNYENRGM